MPKIFRRINSFAKFVITIFVKLLLCVIYYCLLFPFGITIGLFTDFLEIKKYNGGWIPRQDIKDINSFLKGQ